MLPLKLPTAAATRLQQQAVGTERQLSNDTSKVDAPCAVVELCQVLSCRLLYHVHPVVQRCQLMLQVRTMHVAVLQLSSCNLPTLGEKVPGAKVHSLGAAAAGYMCADGAKCCAAGMPADGC